MIATIRETIQFLLYVRYRWHHDSRWPWGAYDAALIDVLGAAAFTALTLAACFKFSIDWWILQQSDPRWLQYLKCGILFITPGYFVLKFFFPKDDLLATGQRYDDIDVSTGQWLLTAYQVIIFVVFLVAVIVRK